VVAVGLLPGSALLRTNLRFRSLVKLRIAQFSGAYEIVRQRVLAGNLSVR
jgi:hypothetical protein